MTRTYIHSLGYVNKNFTHHKVIENYLTYRILTKEVVITEASTTAKTVVLLLFGKNSYSTVFLTTTPVKLLFLHKIILWY